jgi:hypothetical protein
MENQPPDDGQCVCANAMAGPSFHIEKSRRRMIAKDIAAAMAAAADG